MKPGQRHWITATSKARLPLWIDCRYSDQTADIFPEHDTALRFDHINPKIINRTTIIIPIPGQPGVSGSSLRLSRGYLQSGVF